MDQPLQHFIVTPTFRAAYDYARDHDLRPREWKHVRAPSDVWGVRPPFKIIIRSWRGARMTQEQIEAVAYLRRAEEIHGA